MPEHPAGANRCPVVSGYAVLPGSTTRMLRRSQNAPPKPPTGPFSLDRNALNGISATSPDRRTRSIILDALDCKETFDVGPTMLFRLAARPRRLDDTQSPSAVFASAMPFPTTALS